MGGGIIGISMVWIYVPAVVIFLNPNFLFFKSLLNLLQYCFYFMFRFFGHVAHGIFTP